MRKPKKLDPIAIRLEPDVREGLEALARADDRSLSAYAHRVLKQHVERERAKAERKG
jgi:predicted transcriptional regulator